MFNQTCAKITKILPHFLIVLKWICSNYISPVGIFYAIFCLKDFSSDAFDFSSSQTDKTDSAQRELSALFSAQTVLETYVFGVKGGS